MAASARLLKFLNWLPLLAAFVVPGSGHVLLGRSTRGLLMLFWMIIFGYITFHLSPSPSMIGRLSGGIAVWVLSVLDVYKFLKRKLTTGNKSQS